MSSDELLERIEKLLLRVLEKLEKLEDLLSNASVDPAQTVALEVAMFSMLPAHKAVKVVRDTVAILRKAKMSDPITRAIVEVLLTHGEGITISDLTRKVRELRGTASRRIVSERLKSLEDRGVVVMKRAGKTVRVYIKSEVVNLEKDS
ncbi:MAG: hypothetical protein QW809_00610 [Sulfolobales archaeon]